MKSITVYFSIVLFSLFSGNCFSQDIDSIFYKAKYLYENNEYQLAIPYFSRYIEKVPSYYKTYQLRGNCYLEVGQISKAIQDYFTALKFNKDNDLVFNLGNAYEKTNDFDSAIFYFRKYIELEPGHADGYIRLSIIYMDSQPEMDDSAVFYAGKAVKIDPANPLYLNFLAMAYYSGNHYKSALETARIGLDIDSTSSLLYQTAGISSFFMKDYSSAINYFDRSIKYNPSDLTLVDYKIQSMLLKNTDPEKLVFQPGKRLHFKTLSVENKKKAAAMVMNPKGSYFYNSLDKKLEASPLKMSIDQFFMLYYGYSLQEGKSSENEAIVASLDKRDPNKEAEGLEEMLQVNPTDFPLYLNLADIYVDMGNNEKYLENRFKYFGFVEGIKATGDGSCPETAFVVNDVRHEYNIVSNLGYRVKSQSMVKQKNHYFDVLHGTDLNNKDSDIYFNVDIPYSKMSDKSKK